MRTRLVAGSLFALVVVSASSAQTPLGTAFTYQGRLENVGSPATGFHDLRFRLFDAAAGGTQIGATLCLNNVSVAGGLFTVSLDFGAEFGGQERFLQIDVRADTGLGCANPAGLISLTPRQALTATPYAAFAARPWETSEANGGSVSYANGTVGIGTNSPATSWKLHVVSNTGSAVRVEADLPTGAAQGAAGYFSTTSDIGNGLLGEASSLTGITYGIRGRAQSPDGWAGYFEGRGHFQDMLFVGRENRIGSEYFGVHAPVGNGEFGGMYISTTGAGGRPFYGYAAGGNVDMWHYYDGDTNKWHVNNNGNRLTVESGGNVGIGTTNPAVPLHVEGGTDVSLSGGGYLELGPGNGTNLVMDNNEIMARSDGNTSTLYLNKAGGDVIIAPLFTTHVGVLEITGGADLSERFDVNRGDAKTPADRERSKIGPGMVVCIDAEHPGELQVATRAYDTAVAGVISGAGGVKPGMMMSQAGSLADGQHAVALTGRVYCLVDAGEGAIKPGDLLTTSDTPGHAMRAADSTRAQGAIIGKAMTALPAGERGLVLVLVSLQ